MITWHEELPFDFSHPETGRYFTENALFFDIETTGFSAARTTLYMIGCAARKNERLIIDQFFAESPAAEAEVLHAFLDYLRSFDTVITYNGIGFDIPYLTAKCKKYNLPEPFAGFTFVDIYKLISGFRFLLGLPNLKQKTIEKFLGIGREDLYDGGELIEVYSSFAKAPEDGLAALLKQHNYEDVLSMPKLLVLLSYSRVLSGGFEVLSVEGSQHLACDGTTCRELFLSLAHEAPVPKRVSCHYEDFHLVMNETQTKLGVRLFTHELKYFFPDYRNYVYLPDEDFAVPKNLASAVEKERKKKATAATCYTKKNAIFVPQYNEVQKPAFRLMYKDKKSYFELSEEFLSSKEQQKEYVLHVFAYIGSRKK